MNEIFNKIKRLFQGKSIPGLDLHGISKLLKKWFFAGCSKMPRRKASEILRKEAYLDVRRNDEG
jgi:hypothetical protein